MRSNYFGEQILQPGDSYGDLEAAWEQKFGELPSPGSFNVELGTTEDETYKFGGEFRDNETGEGVAFDGFASVEAARDWLVNELQIAEGDIEERED